ncbi:hypothetical protein Hypma_006616 [Hypsizygus marmoreus]|uniref:Presenilins-associated rhomboid-like protein, mitochondrial n=1 Tax=Hypsizygus marmoreus TaxID=39966 RepID=A0A369K337_HYPMA|nr:hypothetical protein Hypma_006616 [Hypsizygus marmoreus]
MLRGNYPPELSQIPPKIRWLRPSLFFVGTSAMVFTVAAYVTNVATDHYLTIMKPKDNGADVSNRQLYEFMQRYHLQSNSVTGVLKAIHEDLLFPGVYVLLMFSQFLWGIDRFQTSLFRHWTHSMGSGKSYTILTSIVSMGSLSQFLLISMVAGHGQLQNKMESLKGRFRAPLDDIHEVSSAYHIVAFWVSAGMFGLLAPQFVHWLRFRSALRSLASGIPPNVRAGQERLINKTLRYQMGPTAAFYASLTLLACHYHSATMTISIPAWEFNYNLFRVGTMWMGWCSSEFILMLIGLGPINWAGHLCGVLYGALYYRYGFELWRWLRRKLYDRQRSIGGSIHVYPFARSKTVDG